MFQRIRKFISNKGWGRKALPLPTVEYRCVVPTREEEPYEQHLGLSDDQLATILSLPGDELSHFLEFDEELYRVETWARHLPTGEVYLSRVRSMTALEVQLSDDRKLVPDKSPR